MSFLERIFGTTSKPRTLLDDFQEVVGKLTVKGYREIAAQHDCAPTAKTTDQQIMEIYSEILATFQQAAQQRGEHIPALYLNTIAHKFFQVYEMMGEQGLQEHLRYEAQKYLAEGLRPDYKRELHLFDPDGNDPDVKRLLEIQKTTREALDARK